jgi:hypothetical protein
MKKTQASVIAYSKKNLLLIAAVVILLLIAVPYWFGYRIGPGLQIERVGTLVVTNLPKGASVFVDQSLHGITPKAENMRDELVAGSHSIIVSVPGDYPWSTLALIASTKTTTINPILVSLKPSVTPLTGSASSTALAAIASTTLPSITHPLKLANGCTLVYVTNNQVIEDASATPGCTPAPYLCDNGSCSPTIIFAPIMPLSLVTAYPGRQDALVVGFSNALYAIALDPRSPQFFAPILTGTQPIFGLLPDGTIVVHDGKAVYKVNF